ncbi:MAG TPA: GNAT family N-acetyltransferase [Actinomycetota bacterium]
MSDEVIIRSVRPGDGAALADRWVEFGRYYASRDPARFRVPEVEGLARWFGSRIDEPHDLWLVAERSGVIVGFLEARVWPAPDDASRQLMRELAEPSLHVTTLFVTERERGRGVGRSLMQAAEDWGREHGATSAAVIAIADSPLAVPFYAGMEYQQNTIGFWKTI